MRRNSPKFEFGKEHDSFCACDSDMPREHDQKSYTHMCHRRGRNRAEECDKIEQILRNMLRHHVESDIGRQSVKPFHSKKAVCCEDLEGLRIIATPEDLPLVRRLSSDNKRTENSKPAAGGCEADCKPTLSCTTVSAESAGSQWTTTFAEMPTFSDDGEILKSPSMLPLR